MTSKFFRFRLIVTGKGEQEFLPDLLRALTVNGGCHFKVLRRVDQRGPHSARRTLTMVGRGQTIPTKDEQEIGLPARRQLEGDADSFVLVIDDLEHDRREQRREIFTRYRSALDHTLGPHFNRASVHFLVFMLEAYYFADPEATSEVLGCALGELPEDVETIRHPKNRLKKLAHDFDELRDGRAIVKLLDLERILANPNACASLRTLVAWCTKKMGQARSDRFSLAHGVYDVVTGPQLGDDLASLARPSPG